MELCDLNILFDVKIGCYSCEYYDYFASYYGYELQRKLFSQINTMFDYKNVKTSYIPFPIHEIDDYEYNIEYWEYIGEYYIPIDYYFQDEITDFKDKAIYRRIMEMKRWLYDNKILYKDLEFLIFDDKYVKIHPRVIYKIGDVCHPIEAIMTDDVTIFLAHNCLELLTFDEIIKLVDEHECRNIYKYLYKNYADEVKKRAHLLTYNSKCYHYYCYKKLC